MARSLIRLTLAGAAVASGLAFQSPATAETCLGTFVCVYDVVGPICPPMMTPQVCVII